MHARNDTFRTPLAPAATWRQRMAVAMARRFSARHAAPMTPMTPMTPMLTEPRSAERFERMELDQRVREIGEW